MEKAEGRQLKTVIDRFGAIDWESSRNIMQGIFAAIEEIHRTGIVHRDLKPENVMVKSTKSGPRNPKIIDFGVCYIDGFQEFWPQMYPTVQVPPRYTPAGAEFATPEFRAPEFDQEDANRNPAFDIYSAGLIFYNLVSGTLPFDTLASTSSPNSNARAQFRGWSSCLSMPRWR
jgi:serine/threonine-protein kinase